MAQAYTGRRYLADFLKEVEAITKLHAQALAAFDSAELGDMSTKLGEAARVMMDSEGFTETFVQILALHQLQVVLRECVLEALTKLGCPPPIAQAIKDLLGPSHKEQELN